MRRDHLDAILSQLRIQRPPQRHQVDKAIAAARAAMSAEAERVSIWR